MSTDTQYKVIGTRPIRHDGADKVTGDYDTLRRRDVLPRQAAIHTLNSSLLADLAPVHTLRALGLTAISQIAPLRNRIIKEGLAPGNALPRVMRT